MLRELLVEGLGVIERAELALEEGTTALTGETGAGKTLLVAAVGLLLGGRADRSMVRQESGEARIEGRFEVPPDHAVVPLLVENGLVNGTGDDAEGPVEVVVFRTVGITGGGRIRVNGRMVTAQLVQEITAPLVEITGQHEHQRLGSPAAQRALLDTFAGEAATAAELADAVRRGAAARRRLDELHAEEAESVKELDRLRFEVDEIEGAGFTVGEWDSLAEEAAALEAAEARAAGLAQARDALHADGGATETLRRAARALAAVEGADDLADLVDRLEAAATEVDDVGSELARRFAEPDPERLAVVRDRIDELSKLRRRFGGDDSAISEHLERARTRLAELETAGADKEAIEAEAVAQEARARDLAARLSDARATAAPRLSQEVTETLARLAMAGTRFTVELKPQDLNEGGNETVELGIATGTDDPRPIAKAASGGELSRISLALHLAVRNSAAPTMIFDEVDAGVGGEAALAVGTALAELGRSPGVQVLVVTHLAQVAAAATAHHRVVKETVGARVRTRVERVEGDDRVEEVSRMLAGMPDSERAREHAHELLELARG